jgi:hypothetical protein
MDLFVHTLKQYLYVHDTTNTYSELSSEELELQTIGVYSGYTPQSKPITIKAKPKFHGSKRFDSIKYQLHDTNMLGKLLVVFLNNLLWGNVLLDRE